jgi:hypothetical protein
LRAPAPFVDLAEYETKIPNLILSSQWNLKTPREDFAPLFNLVSTSRPHKHRKSAIETEAALLAYASEGRLPKLIALVRGFASRRSEAGTTQLH